MRGARPQTSMQAAARGRGADRNPVDFGMRHGQHLHAAGPQAGWLGHHPHVPPHQPVRVHSREVPLQLVPLRHVLAAAAASRPWGSSQRSKAATQDHCGIPHLEEEELGPPAARLSLEWQHWLPGDMPDGKSSCYT